MVDVPRRLVDDENSRMPAAGSYKLYHTATDPTYYTLGVCNGEGADAHITIWIIPGSFAWAEGGIAPPPFAAIHKKQRIEADGIDGNNWQMPTVILNKDDKLVVMTDLVGVTFNGHGVVISG